MAGLDLSAATRPFDKIGWRAKNRPQTGLAHVLAAGGGAFAVLATEALVDKLRSDSATFPGVALNVVLLGVALAVAFLPVGPPRGAAVVALVVAIPLIWIFLFYGDHQPGLGWLRAVYLLSAAMYLALYSMMWTRGRAIFLALTLFFVASYVEFEVHRQFESTSSAAVAVPLPVGQLENPVHSAQGVSSSNLIGRTGDDQAIAAILLGVGFLAMGAVLHRKRYPGAAVPFLVIGALEGFTAAATLGPNEGSVTLGALLAVLVGAMLAFGSRGEGRRGGVWIGVIAIVVATLAMLAAWTTNALGVAGYAALVAVILIGGAMFLSRPLGEPPDGGEPAST